MASLSADDFMARVLEDEGWQSPLDGSSVEAVIARYEALLPPEATVTEARGERMRHALHELAELVKALQHGTLDEATLVAAWLRQVEA